MNMTGCPSIQAAFQLKKVTRDTRNRYAMVLFLTLMPIPHANMQYAESFNYTWSTAPRNIGGLSD